MEQDMTSNRDYSNFPAWEMLLNNYELAFDTKKYSTLLNQLDMRFHFEVLPRGKNAQEMIELNQERKILEDRKNKLREELSIWTAENISALCVYYVEFVYFRLMSMHNKLYLEQKQRTVDEIKKLPDEFYIAICQELGVDCNDNDRVNAKVKFLRTLSRISFEYDTRNEFSLLGIIEDVKNNFIKHIFYKINEWRSSLNMITISEKDVNQAIVNFEKKCEKFASRKSVKEQIDLDIYYNKPSKPIMPEFHAQQIEIARLGRARLAITNIHRVNQEIVNPSDKEIEDNEYLQMALSASYSYYIAKKGWYHGDHGMEATRLFIDKVLSMKDKVLIQNEALRYLKGEDCYEACIGGSSGHHESSRTAFILESGLLDDRLNEIAIVRDDLCQGQGLFSQTYIYKQREKVDARRKLTQEERKIITEEVKQLKPVV